MCVVALHLYFAPFCTVLTPVPIRRTLEGNRYSNSLNEFCILYPLLSLRGAHVLTLSFRTFTEAKLRSSSTASREPPSTHSCCYMIMICRVFDANPLSSLAHAVLLLSHSSSIFPRNNSTRKKEDEILICYVPSSYCIL